jgi:hypothetical protein
MTRTEFIERYRAQQKHGNGWAILWLVSLFGFLTMGAICAKHMESLPKSTQVAAGIGVILLLAGQLPLLRWLLRRETRMFGLHCPACDKPLVGNIAQIAIASGRCGHCGTTLFHDESSTGSPSNETR